VKKTVLSCIVAGVVFLVSCAPARQRGYRPENKMAPAALQQDVRLLKQILEASHPSLYWYTPKDSIDLFFGQTIAAISDSLTELQFRNKMSWVINKIHCGHTQVRFSKGYASYFTGKRLPQFPLNIRVWHDSMVVVHNLHRDSQLKRGTIITSINNMPNRYLLDSMYALIGGDGLTNSFEQQVVSFYFPAFYKSTFGIDSTFEIGYIDSTGVARKTFIKPFRPLSDSLEKIRAASVPRPGRQVRRRLELLGKRNMRIDTAVNTAFISVNTFTDGKLNAFFRRSFRTIEKDNIGNVVIDLRENSGGSIFSSIRLAQYLADKPFKVADTVAAIDRSFKYRKYVKPWFVYWLSMHLTGRKNEDGRIHFRYFERHYFKPRQRNHFNGNTYVLTGGYTFSAATMVAGLLQGQKGITLVGEETGGGAYGNSAVHLPVITLPNSQVRIVLPLYRLVADAKRQKDGRGLLPDVEVLPSSQAIRRGVDLKVEKVKELIRQQAPVANREQ